MEPKVRFLPPDRKSRVVWQVDLPSLITLIFEFKKGSHVTFDDIRRAVIDYIITEPKPISRVLRGVTEKNLIYAIATQFPLIKIKPNERAIRHLEVKNEHPADAPVSRRRYLKPFNSLTNAAVRPSRRKLSFNEQPQTNIKSKGQWFVPCSETNSLSGASEMGEAVYRRNLDIVEMFADEKIDKWFDDISPRSSFYDSDEVTSPLNDIAQFNHPVVCQSHARSEDYDRYVEASENLHVDCSERRKYHERISRGYTFGARSNEMETPNSTEHNFESQSPMNELADDGLPNIKVEDGDSMATLDFDTPSYEVEDYGDAFESSDQEYQEKRRALVQSHKVELSGKASGSKNTHSPDNYSTKSSFLEETKPTGNSDVGGNNKFENKRNFQSILGTNEDQNNKSDAQLNSKTDRNSEKPGNQSNLKKEQFSCQIQPNIKKDRKKKVTDQSDNQEIIENGLNNRSQIDNSKVIPTKSGSELSEGDEMEIDEIDDVLESQNAVQLESSSLFVKPASARKPQGSQSSFKKLSRDGSNNKTKADISKTSDESNDGKETNSENVKLGRNVEKVDVKTATTAEEKRTQKIALRNSKMNELNQKDEKRAIRSELATFSKELFDAEKLKQNQAKSETLSKRTDTKKATTAEERRAQKMAMRCSRDVNQKMQESEHQSSTPETKIWEAMNSQRPNPEILKGTDTEKAEIEKATSADERRAQKMALRDRKTFEQNMGGDKNESNKIEFKANSPLKSGADKGRTDNPEKSEEKNVLTAEEKRAQRIAMRNNKANKSIIDDKSIKEIKNQINNRKQGQEKRSFEKRDDDGGHREKKWRDSGQMNTPRERMEENEPRESVYQEQQRKKKQKEEQRKNQQNMFFAVTFLLFIITATVFVSLSENWTLTYSETLCMTEVLNIHQ